MNTRAASAHYPRNTFDPSAHSYEISGRKVPSVTQVLRAVLPGAAWQASQWHMDRGTATHACAALIAKDKPFVHDPAIVGQVAACRKFFADLKPEVIAVEQQVYSEAYGYAGTYDMLAVIHGKTVIVDWKSSFNRVDIIQLGGYSLAHPAPSPRWGMVVELGEDGKYRTSGLVKLDQARNEFQACLSVFNIHKRLGLENNKEATTDGT
jgi:hypothetical protein